MSRKPSCTKKEVYDVYFSSVKSVDATPMFFFTAASDSAVDYVSLCFIKFFNT